MKKLSVLAIALVATCMFSGCGKKTEQNLQPAERLTRTQRAKKCGYTGGTFRGSGRHRGKY